MKVLLDQNTAKKLRFALRPHLVMAAEQMGLARIANGSLIRIAEEAGFDVPVTADRNLYHQQSNENRQIALVVLSSNYWPDVKLNSEAIADAVNRSSVGTFIEVEIVKAVS